MVKLIFDFLILAIVTCIIAKPKIGAVAVLCSSILIPSMVRFEFGPLSLALSDVLSLSIIAYLVMNRSLNTYQMPVCLKKYYYLFVIGSLAFALFSAEIVPLSYQLKSIFKDLILGEYIVILYFNKTISTSELRFTIRSLTICAIIAGVYGVISYLIHINLYVTITSIEYSGADFAASIFLDEARGGMLGRTCGTMTHPLAWGQFWTIFVPFAIVCRGKIDNKYMCWAIVVLGFLNCLFSGSRTAILCIIISIAFIFIDLIKKNLISFIALFVIAIVSLSFMNKNYLKNNETFNFIQSAVFFWDDEKSASTEVIGSSTKMRESQLDESIKIANRNTFGIGYNYQYYSLNNDRVANSTLWGMESVVFKRLVEQGWMGLLLYFCCVVLLIGYFVRVCIVYRYPILNVAGMFGGFLGSLIITGEQGDSILIFFCLISIIYKIITVENYETQNYDCCSNI